MSESELRKRRDDLEDGASLDALILSGASEEKAGSGDGLDALIGAADARQPKPEASFIGSIWEGTKSVASDIGAGMVEAPRQIAGGIMDAGQAALDATDALGDYLETKLPLGGIRLFNEKGEFDFGYIPPEKHDAAKTGIKLPTTDDADTVTGGMVRGVAQFLAGWGAVGKTLPALTGGKTVASTVGKGMARGALTDAGFFDAHEERLSDLVEKFPALKNPVTEYLASDENDSEAEGRFKNAIEGLGLGILTEGMGHALRALKAVRKARAVDPEQQAKKAADASRGAGDEPTKRGVASDIGPDPDAPLVAGEDELKRKVAEKMRAATKETELSTSATTPKDVVAGMGGEAATREFTRKLVSNVEDLSEMGYSSFPGSDKYFNPEKIETNDDIKTILRIGAQAFKEDIGKAQRGKRSHKQTKAAADKIDAWEVLMKRDGGSALNAEELTAARELWISAGDRLLQLAHVATENPSTENLFRARHMLAVFHAIQKEYMGARTETARALNAMKIPVGSNVTKLANLEDMINQFGGVDANVKLLEGIIEAERTGGRAAVSKVVEKGMFAKTADTAIEIWINSLLSGPKTHLVNILSNASVMANHAMETAVASRIARTMGDETAVAVGEAAAYWAGVRGSMIDAFRNAGKTFRSGVTGYGMNKVEVPFERAVSSTTWDIASESVMGRSIDTIGAIINTPTRLLATGDEFFKTMNYRGAVHQHAYRTARREFERTGGEDLDISGILPPDVATSVRAERKGNAGSLSGSKATFEDRMRELINDPPDDISMASRELAMINTFTNNPRGPMAQMARAVSNLKRNDQSKIRYIAHVLMPFTRTPANIIDYAVFERGPMALLTQRYRADISRGGADAYMANTKLALGSGITLLALDWGLNGTVTGSGPTDYKERAALRRMGWQPYSVKIGDRYYAFNRMDPIGMTLGMGADLAEIIRASDDMDDMTADEWEQALLGSMFIAAENVMSKTYMRGMSSFVEALNNPQRRAAAYIESLAGTIVPTGVKEVATFMDPTLRQHHNIVTKIKSRLPGYSSDLPPRRDAYGREVSYQSGLGPMWDAASPIYSKKWNPEPIDEETRKDGWYVDKPPNYFRSEETGGETVSLREHPHIYNRYVQLRGATKPSDMGEFGEALLDMYGDMTMLETLNAIVKGEHEMSAGYMEQTDAEGRETYIKKVVRNYRKAAQNILFEEFPEIAERGFAKAKRKAERRAQDRREMEGAE